MSLPYTLADLQKKLMGPTMWTNLHVRLSARSRVTNLGVVLLLGALALSLLFHIRRPTVFIEAPRVLDTKDECKKTDFHMRDALPPYPGEDKQPLQHLVIVAGHAIWKENDPARMLDDSSWFLEPYQRNGAVKTFVKHIQEGYVPCSLTGSVKIAAADPTSLLVFSGGQTRGQAWSTEAESYYRLALELPHELPRFSVVGDDLTTSKPPFQPLKTGADAAAQDSAPKLASGSQGIDRSLDLSRLRMTTENFALDSFQNLLFSIARFYEYTNRYPERITVVSYAFKKKRFVDLHAKALRWPTRSSTAGGSSRFTYVGIDDEGSEHKAPQDNAYSSFEVDMYGCWGRLREKRKRRNGNRRLAPYTATAPQLGLLLDWCPEYNSRLQGLFQGWLPWDERVLNAMGRGAQAMLEQNGGILSQAEYLPDGKKIV